MLERDAPARSPDQKAPLPLVLDISGSFVGHKSRTGPPWQGRNTRNRLAWPGTPSAPSETVDTPSFCRGFVMTRGASIVLGLGLLALGGGCVTEVDSIGELDEHITARKKKKPVRDKVEEVRELTERQTHERDDDDIAADVESYEQITLEADHRSHL